MDISECSNDPKAIAEAIYESDEREGLFDQVYEIFPEYNTDGNITADATEWIVTRLVNTVAALDELPDETTNEVIDHLFEMTMEGLT